MLQLGGLGLQVVARCPVLQFITEMTEIYIYNSIACRKPFAESTASFLTALIYLTLLRRAFVAFFTILIRVTIKECARR